MLEQLYKRLHKKYGDKIERVWLGKTVEIHVAFTESSYYRIKLNRKVHLVINSALYQRVIAQFNNNKDIETFIDAVRKVTKNG